MRVETFYTESKGHAISLTRRAVLQGVDIVLAAGGDGTLNEVVNGLFYELTDPEAEGQLGVLINPEIKVAYFPAGTLTRGIVM